LGLPCDLLVRGFHLNTFLTVLYLAFFVRDQTNLVFKPYFVLTAVILITGYTLVVPQKACFLVVKIYFCF